MHARIRGPGFGRHSHATYAIGVLEHGFEELSIAGRTNVARAGDLVVFNPDTPHTGRPIDNGGWTYRVLYPTPAELADITGHPAPTLREGVLRDRGVAIQLRDAHEALERSDEAATRETLRKVLRALCSEFNDPAHCPKPLTDDLLKARALLLSDVRNPPSGPELATSLGRGTQNLSRAFARSFGLPPRAYLNQHRLRRAADLLDLGHPIAEVAGRVGFADQSHLTRHFRRARGITPGEYARKNVQDGTPPGAIGSET